MKYDLQRPSRAPRILIYDIETSYNMGSTWGKWQQNVMHFTEQKHLFCFAYKWHGEDDDQIKVIGQTDFMRAYKKNKRDDRQVAQELWKLFEEADIIVAHNGNSFDQKETQLRFLVHDLPKTSPYKQIDTKLIARRNFRMNSNSLNDIGKQLGLGKKLPHFGFEMWEAIYEDRDPEMWQTMRDYNVQDVVLLGKVYEKFLYNGWIDNHPNMAMISGMLDACPKCGTEGRMMKRGFYYTSTQTKVKYQCGHCNSYSSERKSGTGPRFS